MESRVWSFADAWLIVSAASYGRRGCDLSHLIATADAYNHDIPTPDAVTRGIGRLVATRLAETTKDRRIRLTPAGRSLAKKAKGGMFERVPHLLSLLEAVPLAEGEWPLHAGEWQEAYDRYAARMR